MKKSNDSASEMLHALADGQLGSQEREEILSILEDNPELRGEMCDIYRIKDLVQTAYPLEDFKQNPNAWPLSKYTSMARVASYLIAFLLTLGAGYTIRDTGMLSIQLVDRNNSNGISLEETKAEDNKVIVFLSSSEPYKFTKALSKAETLAKKYQHTEGKVYVVTSAAGIDLLRTKTSPHKQKIIKLSDMYPSLHFVACNNTLYQFKKAGKPVELIKNAEVAPSAVDFVVKHLQQGWRYIAI